MPPGGGPRDTIPPVFVSATPKDSSLHFNSHRVTFYFNEYVELDNVLEKLIVSPTLKRTPVVTAKFRTVTINIKDTLKPNTTYTFNFDDAIRDVNERNPVKDFQYVVSTGDYLDSLEIKGMLKVAETGLADSNVAVMLYTNLEDSVVSKEKPQYLAKTKGDGSFHFRNLAPGTYKMFAIKEEDRNLQYSSMEEPIAFLDSTISILSENVEDVQLLLFKAYDTTQPYVAPLLEEEESNDKKAKKPKLTVSNNLSQGKQELNDTFHLKFSIPIADLSMVDSSRMTLAEDTTLRTVPFRTLFDSTGTRLSILYDWKEGRPYRLILPKGFATDTLGQTTAKADTLNFSAKTKTDYGIFIGKLEISDETRNILNADTSLRLIMQLVADKKVAYSGDITGGTWKQELINPAEYEIRILFDQNGNGIWDTGSYYISPRKQPERVVAFPKKINIKANWMMPETFSL
ncbi:Ig-like domain-containing domain [Chitinophaga caeni]|uniref:Ig-like domain-containing domain n=1 Tax=Chitinophaga caeni TaxID=2029983 RepID=UPI0012FE3702|nr:Ig-like domain-containing domain [Chitinophaga caeni]